MMEGRIKICEERGIKMIIQPRKPCEGLAERSSTSMKARMRAMIHQEDEGEIMARQSLPVEAFNEHLPWRLCFAGGWMDLQWCNEIFPGSAITINIKYNPSICRDFCGLATSSRKVAAKVWNGRVPRHLEATQAAQFLWGAENL